MSAAYPPPIYFVTVDGNPASQAVLQQLGASLPPATKDRYSLITQSTPASLIESYTTIPIHLTVALFDVPSGTIKHYKPLHLTQPDSNRPNWASRPLWSVAIRTDKAKYEKVIRDCARQIAAWFSTGIKHAIPGQSYPWGPIPTSECNSVLQRLAQNYVR